MQKGPEGKAISDEEGDEDKEGAVSGGGEKEREGTLNDVRTTARERGAAHKEEEEEEEEKGYGGEEGIAEDSFVFVDADGMSVCRSVGWTLINVRAKIKTKTASIAACPAPCAGGEKSMTLTTML